MSNIKYYKSTHPEVISAMVQREDAINKLRKEGEIFSNHYQGKLVISNSLDGFRIFGLSFDQPKDTAFWTVPDKKALNIQRPRNSIRAGSKKDRETLETLKEEFKNLLPRNVVPLDPVIESIGSSIGNLFLSPGGISINLVDETAYFKTAIKLNDRVIEITASEYEEKTTK